MADAMNSSLTTHPACASATPKSGAALELLGYLASIAAATLCFVMGWLTIDQAAVLTLLMLVSAFAGRERVLEAYHHAVRERYRFFSYGDCMFLE